MFKCLFVVFFQALHKFPFLEGGQEKNKLLILFLYEEFEIYLTFKGSIPSHEYSTFLLLTSCYFWNYELILSLTLILSSKIKKRKMRFLNLENIFVVKLGKNTRHIEALFVTPVAKSKPIPVFTGSKSWSNLKTVSSNDLHGITIRMAHIVSVEYCPS